MEYVWVEVNGAVAISNWAYGKTIKSVYYGEEYVYDIDVLANKNELLISRDELLTATWYVRFEVCK